MAKVNVSTKESKLEADTTPYAFPPLTEIKRSIPNECYESSLTVSMYYTIRALVFASSLPILLHYCRNLDIVNQNVLLDTLVCMTYIFVQGIVFWGFFTIGHDCGHGSFSRYSAANFAVGTLMHSIILTPFESWKLSHRHHHKNTGNIDTDEIFYPHREKDAHPYSRYLVMLFGGAWFAYLFYGFPPRIVNHFNAWDGLFVRHVAAVLSSVVSHLLVLSLYISLTFKYGTTTLGLYLWAPLFVFASMLVITTFLHHNDEETTWYADSEWTYVKGNLQSIDRSYGAFIDNISHNIGTHQVHHLFPIIPHYKLKEATRHFRKAFPELVRESHEPILTTFIRIGMMYARYGVVGDHDKTFTLKQAQNEALKNQDMLKSKTL